MLPKFVELHPRLFVRGHTKSLDPTVTLDMLRFRKIGYVLNVAIIPDSPLQAGCRTIGIRYDHVPMSDSKMSVEKDLVLVLAADVAKIMEHSGVLIHCDSGHNRSNLVALLALAKHTGRPIDELIAEARVLRPKTLKNPTFEQFVRDHATATS